MRSTCHLQRRSKKRRVPRPKVEVEDTEHPRRPNLRGKITEAYYLNDPLRPFLWGPETKLLTVKEESELIGKIQVIVNPHQCSRLCLTIKFDSYCYCSVFQGLMKLEEVKSRLHSQFGNEPTLVEWAEVIGVSCQALQRQLHFGNRSREKLVHANYRMVVHIARQYQGRGLSLQDLLQVSQTGNFKP